MFSNKQKIPSLGKIHAQSLNIQWWNFLFAPILIYPLITFRILFGSLITYGTVRTWTNGWIDTLYLQPEYFFKFQGFHWVTLPSEMGIYILFILIILSAICIALGLFYRVATIIFFLCFTYKELLDASNYLNHYYLVILFAFLLIFLPAHRFFSLDVAWRKVSTLRKIPSIYIYVLIFQLCLVYTFAGIAKLNTDWLLHALPLRIWLPEHRSMPILGYFFQQEWCAYLFSWMGAIYDLTIACFLLWRTTRPFAYVVVVFFHFITYLLFNIGLFPLIMVSCTLIFFSGEWHERLYKMLPKKSNAILSPTSFFQKKTKTYFLRTSFFAAFFLIQLALPLRHYCYQNNVLWTEEGYRFAWRVMLVEKSGQATFMISNPENGQKAEIINSQYLTPFQEKQMAIQPDFILQMAHLIAEDYKVYHGIRNPIVTVESFVALNARASQRFIDPNVNLTEVDHNLTYKNWVLPFKR